MTPILSNINSYDVSLGIELNYQANNSTTVIGSSRVFILDVDGNLIGFHCWTSDTLSIISEKHIISPKNVTYDSATGIGWVWVDNTKYINNEQYQVYIVTYIEKKPINPTSSDIGASARSNVVGLWTLPQPVVDINLSDISITDINVTSYNVTATYDTNNALINNAPSEVIFDLYISETDELKESSGVIYNSGINNNDGTYTIDYTFSNLKNQEIYYVVTNIVSTQGMITSDGENKDKCIRPIISIPSINVLEVKNNDCEGCVDLETSITNIVGELKSGEIPLVTPNGINLEDDELVFDSGLSFSPNWNFSFWANDFNYATLVNAQSTEYILHFKSEGGYIDIFMIEDETQTYQKAVMLVYPLGYEGLCNYFESNEIVKPVGATKFTCIGIQYKDYLYSISISNVDIPSET